MSDEPLHPEEFGIAGFIRMRALRMDDLSYVARFGAERRGLERADELEKNGHRMVAWALRSLAAYITLSAAKRIIDDEEVRQAEIQDPPLPLDSALLLDVVDALTRDETTPDGVREAWSRIRAAMVLEPNPEWGGTS